MTGSDKWGRRRGMSEDERKRLELYVARMDRQGYSAKVISQSVPLGVAAVRNMVNRLRRMEGGAA